ncbi:MAG TPA: alpha/beta fold hydrolase, partial [Mycobacteriales bacterium]|nr:alpha/beta fold hydrolase [Mycobacteriales bacterium]
ERAGAGEPLLWITGFAISSEIFAPVIDDYAAEFDCIRYDNRGAGRSDVPWKPTSIPELAADAVRLLDALGLDSAHVYGLSMGGMIAQELALRFPDRVRALVLGGTWHGGPRAVLPSPRIATALTSRGAPAAVRAQLVGRALFSERFRAEHPEQVTRHLRNLAAHPASARGLVMHLTATAYHDTRARLPRITAPTLVMHGEVDELTPLRNARLLAELIPDATLEVLPDAGHGYLLEQPAESHRRFTGWLADRSPVPPGRPLCGVAARAEPVTRHLGLQVGALRTARSLVAPPRRRSGR